jgi:hypothetical protein
MMEMSSLNPDKVAFEEAYLEKVHLCRELLRQGVDDCVAQLQVLALSSSKHGELDFRTGFEEILDQIGSTLFRATKPFTETYGPEFEFYYWPGYHSILVDDQDDKRITLWENGPDGRIRCGVGFSSKEEPYKIANTAIWFEKALTQSEEDLISGSFAPGGTHAWVSQDNLFLQGPIREHLIALVLNAAENHAYESKRGIFRVQLDLNDLSHWGERIASYLNDQDLIIANKDWPVPHDDSSAVVVPDVVSIRYNLYNIWLAASFDLLDLNTPWVKRAIQQVKDNGLIRLADRLRENGDVMAYSRPTPFRWWYTLSLEKSVEVTGKPEPLGTAMFLSSHPLNAAYLNCATSFVNEMYFRMRDLESNQKAGVAGQLRQARIFAHQTAGLITVPWNDPGRTDLEPESQFLLWMAVTLLTQIWGSTRLDPRQAINDDVEFYEWQDLDTLDMLNKIASFALLQGLQRASKAPKPSKDASVEAVNWRAAKLAAVLLQDSDRITSLRHRLGFIIPSQPTHAWMSYKGFILCFHHSLWQATHHAFKASLEVESERYLWMDWDETSVTIWNRAFVSPESKTFSSPDSRRKKKSTDREFLDLLQVRLNEVFAVDGPEEVKAEGSEYPSGVWRTIITYKENPHNDSPPPNRSQGIDS